MKNFSKMICFLLIVLEGRPIDSDLRKSALDLQKTLDWEDAGPELAAVLGGTDTGIIHFICKSNLLFIFIKLQVVVESHIW